ncbi:MAG: hypothetical protein LAO77_11965 [Acidobacteriia bacterium]|nr:hypothetical protein [Terriglobia bacterium]
MTTHVDRMVRAIRDVESELAQQVDAQRLVAFLRQARPIHFLLIPVIYSLLVPLVLLDAWMTLYQWCCFPAYGIPRLRRGAYFVMDRHKLAYLNAIEKVHCTYCSYATGLVTYARDIAAQTEQYWCPIKHGRAIPPPHALYHAFVDYGDAIGYHRDLPALRQALRDARPGRHGREMALRENRKAV